MIKAGADMFQLYHAYILMVLYQACWVQFMSFTIVKLFYNAILSGKQDFNKTLVLNPIL